MITTWTPETAREYLATVPNGNHEQWLKDLYNALKCKWIDGFDATLAMKRHAQKWHNLKDLRAPYWKLIEDEFDKQERENARVYMEQQKSIKIQHG